MNKRQIILDFTSLLDVIMIILFFFILFASLKADEALETQAEFEAQQEQLNAEKAECEALKKEAEEKSNKADKALAEYQEALSNLENSGESAAQNIAEMHKFDQSMNLKIRLNLINKSKNWQLEIYSGKEKIGTVKNDTVENMVNSLSAILIEAGYSTDKTILCEFFYDSHEEGSKTVCDIVDDLFTQVRFSYSNFKVSETDTSIFTQANTTEEDIKNGKK